MQPKQNKLSLFIFVDALGWEILNSHPDFLKGAAIDRKKLRTILGYSSACDPSIISGLRPSQHGLWSSYYYSPKTSPFADIKWLRFLPSVIKHSSRFRHLLSKYYAQRMAFSGYFQLYNVPFEYLPYFDYAEKKWIWGQKQRLPFGYSIFDHLLKHRVPFYVKPDSSTSDETQWDDVQKAIKDKNISYAYLMLGQLDAVMHAKGNAHPDVTKVVKKFDEKIRNLIDLANQNYQEVAWYVFSDHGMHNVSNEIDLQSIIQKLGLSFGKDYIAFYDSTMARFWYLNDSAKTKILKSLQGIKQGRILTDAELKQEGIFFANRRYGETLFLLEPSCLLVPSYMGQKRIAGMHGYHPDDAPSAAMICSNRFLPPDLTSIEQIFWIMIQELSFPHYTKFEM